MKIGHLKDHGSVQHLWEEFGDFSYTWCSPSYDKQYETSGIEFCSDKPGCKACIHKGQQALLSAKRNLAKLGVK